MGLAGQVSLGQAAFFAVGAYAQALLVTRYQVPMVVAAVVAVGSAMLVALLVGMPLLRLRGHYLALATLGLGIIVTVLATESDYLGATSGLYGIASRSSGAALRQPRRVLLAAVPGGVPRRCCWRATSSPAGSAERSARSTTRRWPRNAWA